MHVLVDRQALREYLSEYHHPRPSQKGPDCCKACGQEWPCDTYAKLHSAAHEEVKSPLAPFMYLTDEELAELWTAIQIRIQHMRSILQVAQAPKIKEDANKVLLIDLSLSTALSEARMSIANWQEKQDA